MVDRYRELEGLKNTRKLDVVLMATVSSFGALEKPSAAERRRFVELFPPVYEASTAEARRQAVAALSSHPYVPQEICHYIGTREISISAPFLARSPAISDETLTRLIETMGEEHIRAIIHRADLSQKVIQALIGCHRPQEDETPEGNFDVRAGYRDESEALRQTLKAMAAKAGSEADDRLGLSTLSELQTALLVRFARRGEGPLFLETLARALGGDRVLAADILAEASGRRLAVALVALGMGRDDTLYVLPRVAPGLSTAEISADEAAERLIGTLKPTACIEELLAWQNQRADEEATAAKDAPRRQSRRSA
ncbi:hypothetical protein FF124_15970 [Martelella lutilitoris]|uniref:DUF2336 domain-containing protein n=1 Tax=Martelella lutilitoris TaxID=2583532 RepID=A0A5C4JPC4_9HYPH|nr:hypothetical protein [Martelella lutilitoris]TNB47042.1 hypothetical protein FF124_15970 [Martelella lutilitoris]